MDQHVCSSVEQSSLVSTQAKAYSPRIRVVVVCTAFPGVVPRFCGGEYGVEASFFVVYVHRADEHNGEGALFRMH